MRLFCETVVNEVLPAVRSIVARELAERGYTQTEIADMMGVTQPAVSQYLSTTRGQRVQRIKAADVVDEALDELVAALLERRGDAECARHLWNVCEHVVENDVIAGSGFKRGEHF